MIETETQTAECDSDVSTSGLDAHEAPESHVDTFDIVTLEALMRNRAATYRLLSRLYLKEVDAETLDALYDTRFPRHPGNEVAEEGINLIIRYLDNTWEYALDELAIDYTRTFFNPGLDAYAAAHPYESVHTSQRHLTMQDAYEDVIEVYRQQGIVRNRDTNLQEDHIACELEFMSIITTRCADAFENGDEENGWSLLELQSDFIKRHLLNWVPLLTLEMLRFAQTAFYQGLAKYTNGFMKQEQQLFEIPEETVDA